MKHVKIDERTIKLQIWDTAGQERFKSISSSYLRNAHGCIAVYDITKRESFESLKGQIRTIVQHMGTGQSAPNLGLKSAFITAGNPPAVVKNHSCASDQERSDIQYAESDYLTAKSIIKHDEANCRGEPHNVILVGTKLDIADKDESKRAVKFQEALDLAISLNLSGLVETSSKDCEKRVGMKEDLNDSFSICAINCYDLSLAK